MATTKPRRAWSSASKGLNDGSKDWNKGRLPRAIWLKSAQGQPKPKVSKWSGVRILRGVNSRSLDYLKQTITEGDSHEREPNSDADAPERTAIDF